MGRIKHEMFTFAKAELTASVASVVDFGLALLLSDVMGVYYGLANAIGVTAGGVTNCCLNYRYVFGDNHLRKRRVAWRYFLVWVVSWILNAGAPLPLPNLLTAVSTSMYTICCPNASSPSWLPFSSTILVRDGSCLKVKNSIAKA